MENLYPGTRVMVYNSRLYRDDDKTPVSQLMQPATIVQWYGKIRTTYSLFECIDVHTVMGTDLQEEKYYYPNLIDVLFDNEDKVSKGHFVDTILLIEKEGI